MTDADDPFALTEEQREAIAADIAAAKAAGAQDWQEIFASHMDMRRRFAYVAGDDVVVDLRDPSRVHSWKGFRNLTAGSTRTIVGPRGGERMQLVADDWLVDRERLTVKGFTFHPNAPRITRNLIGQSAVNLWSVPRIASEPLPEDWAARAEVLGAHLEYLIPGEVERDMVHRWMAYRVQRPEALPGWHLLLIAERTEGTGRNWLARLLAELMPGYVVEDLRLKQILAGESNGDIAHAIVGVVDEIREGGKDKWTHAEDLKSFLTKPTRTINEKYLRKFTVQNFMGVMMFSNYLDALPINDSDRRHYVVRCTRVPRPKAYYDELYAALKDRAVLRALWEHLTKLDLRGFAIEGRAPTTDIKTEAIEASRSGDENELLRLVKSWPGDLIFSTRLRILLQRHRDEDLAKDEYRPAIDQLTRAKLIRLYAACGVKALGDDKKLTIEGEPNKQRVVALRNYEKWKRATLPEIRAELERGNRPRVVVEQPQEGST